MLNRLNYSRCAALGVGKQDNCPSSDDACIIKTSEKSVAVMGCIDTKANALQTQLEFRRNQLTPNHANSLGLTRLNFICKRSNCNGEISSKGVSISHHLKLVIPGLFQMMNLLTGFFHFPPNSASLISSLEPQSKPQSQSPSKPSSGQLHNASCMIRYNHRILAMIVVFFLAFSFNE